MTYYKGGATSGFKSNKRNPLLGVLVILLTLVVIYVLNTPLGTVPPLGRLLDPVNGCWASAVPADKNYSADFAIKGLKSDVSVWIDDRLVPHIHAANEHDLYCLQGYIHASFRLWQMDMQTRAAAGRISEVVVGQKAFDFDRKQRRKGMVFAAENSLRACEADPRTKQVLDAYTEGVNAYIASIGYKNYPLEYKLLSFVPEPWTNLKTVFLLKYMADDLTGKTDDLGLTYLKEILPMDVLNLLYPEKIPGSTPVIPSGTHFDSPTLAMPVAPSDSLAFPRYKVTDFGEKRVEGKGSNNWALAGSRTASGYPILCNDPHLGLNLPSLWYEVQLQAPGINVYGASLPGAPGVIIGFNDSLSWGVTNNYRDVKDYYEIKAIDGSNKYWFAGQQLEFSVRQERIKTKGKPDFIDTVKYTIHGPVMYDNGYTSNDGLRRMLAVCWMGHRPTNEMLAVYLLNRARNYNEYTAAIQNFQCPAQNFAYADRAGNIALWGQGQFVNKWKEQGRFVMNGSDSSTLWKELIPVRENPHVLNPPQGFVSSANQSVTDSTYPYWYNGDFIELRAWRINQVLAGMQKATVNDMFALQNDTHSWLAENALPVMLRYSGALNDKYINALRKWNYNLDAESEAATAFQVWWYYLYTGIWKDDFTGVPDFLLPLTERTMQLITTDSMLSFYDDKRTAQVERLGDMVIRSYHEAMDSIGRLIKEQGSAAWYKAKNTSVTHLGKLSPFSYNELKTGGWGNTVNAMKGDHGPSWRMVVQMGKNVEAYGVYPGGQSGNSGSKYYNTFLKYWEEGKYYPLLFLPNAEKQNNSSIKYIWTVKPKS